MELEAETAQELSRLQTEADGLRVAGVLQPTDHWKNHRTSPSILGALAALKRMAGQRQRCMYCVDSLGPDIEHFWPKTPYPMQMYVWENLLLVCTDCGRKKGSQFPLSAAGQPLLIDPTSEDPWEFLDFDPVTGNLNARYLLSTEKYSAKGETTVKVLHLNRREGVSASYLVTYTRLCRLVGRWADEGLPDNYVERLREEDERGLLGWFLHSTGQNESAFSRFRGEYPEAWADCQQAFH